MAERIRDGIAAVRGRVYTAQQSIALYPTTATTHDYAYARHFIDTGRRRILGLTVETAREFQPADVEKNNVIAEVSAGLMECLVETLCPADVVQSLNEALFPLRAMRRFRDRHMLKTAAGARYSKMFRAHSLELTGLALSNKTVREAGASLLKIAGRFFSTRDEVLPRKIAKEDLIETDKALAVVRKQASAKLKAAVDTALADLKRLQGKPLTDAFRTLNALEAKPGTKKTKPSVASRGARRGTKPPKKSAKKGEARSEALAFSALRLTRACRRVVMNARPSNARSGTNGRDAHSQPSAAT